MLLGGWCIPPTQFKIMVTITRSGNLIEVDPALPGLLSGPLSYNRVVLAHGISFGGKDRSIVPTPLFKIHENKLLTTQGAFSRIVSILKANGIPYTFKDLRTKQELTPDYANLCRMLPDFVFRAGQDTILATLIGANSGCVVAPTAYGKTTLIMALVALYPTSKIIIASPSTSLLHSVYRRLQTVTVQVGRVGDGFSDPNRVTLTTLNSILRCDVNNCDILLIDEAHRAAATNAAKSIARVRSPVKIFGFTATPTGRSDSAELVTEVLIGPVLAEITYQEAAQAGIVADIIPVLIDPPVTEYCSSQFWKTRVGRKRNLYWRNTARTRAFADAVLKLRASGFIEDPQSLVLVDTVDHAFRFKALLPDFEVVYRTLSKTKLEELKRVKLIPADYTPISSSRRRQLLFDFESGKLKNAIATGCWGEGVDFRFLNVLANASGAASKIPIVQWAGRASRVTDTKVCGILVDSMDTWDGWARTRAQTRIREYKRKGWKIIDASKGVSDEVVDQLKRIHASSGGSRDIKT